jgi:hypothetical protein
VEFAEALADGVAGQSRGRGDLAYAAPAYGAGLGGCPEASEAFVEERAKDLEASLDGVWIGHRKIAFGRE